MVTILKKGAPKKRLRAVIADAKKAPAKKTLDAYQFCGKVKFKADGLTLQKEWRNEWE